MRIYRCSIVWWLLLAGGLTGMVACTGPTGGPSHPAAAEPPDKARRIPDTAAISRMIDEASQLMRTSPDSAVAAYHEALAFSRQAGFHAGTAAIWNNLAAYYLRTPPDFEAALGCGWKSLRYYIAAGNKAAALRACTGLAGIYYMQGSYDRVKGLYARAYPFYDPEDDRLQLARFRQYMADSYVATGSNDSAVLYCNYILVGLGRPDTASYTFFISAYNTLTGPARITGAYDRAIAYLDQAAALAQQYRDTSRMVLVLNNKIAVYQEQRRPDAARQCALAALAISRKMGYHHFRAYSASALSALLVEAGNPQAALPYSLEGYKSADSSGYFSDKIDAAFLLGNNYAALGRHREAIACLLPAVALSEKEGQVKNIADAYNVLSTSFSATGDYRKALLYKSRYAAVRDSVMGRERIGRIAEVETRYRVAQKDKELAASQLRIAQQEKERMVWAGGALAVLLLAGGLLYRRRQQAAMARLKAEMAGQEQERARLARELHDGIVSRLSLIKLHFTSLPQHHGEESGAEEFREVVRQLDQSILELRATAHNLLPDILRQSGLETALRTYCAKIGSVAGLEVSFQVVGELPRLTDDFQLHLYRIIQEVMHNIIKHSGARTVLLQLVSRDGLLEVTIDDDGRFAPPGPGEGMGLHSLRARIAYLGGQMSMEQHDGTSLYLTFDLSRHRPA